jgi:CheY-like chemotaxis protein
MEAQFLQAQKMEAVGRLAGGIAHDFNNILVPIVGYVELGMMNLSPNDKLYINLKRVKQAADRATGLVRQILAFSRKQVLEMKVLDLNAVVMDFKKMLQRLIGEDIEFQTFLEPALYRVDADAGQIEQVLMNLVINARDAMPDGGKLTIETANTYLDQGYVSRYAGAQLPGHYVMLAVSDTGCGMDAETRQQIFEPFFTTKEPGKGTGLGLSTVFGIIKQHGGNVWVYSEPDKGTTFKIYLPQVESTGETPETAPTEIASIYGTETILVVEDEEMVRRLVCETLSACGYEVLEAQSPNDALRLASERKGTFDLLLTDIIMPEMNGRDMYQKMTAIDPDIKVLYMSGYTDDVVVYHGILDEGVNYLQKPFTIQSLTRKVRLALNQGNF